MGPAKRPRSRAEIRGKVLDVGRPRIPPEVTTAEQACEEPAFDVSWTRVRFPPPPQKSSAMRSFFVLVEVEGIEPSGWRGSSRPGARPRAQGSAAPAASTEGQMAPSRHSRRELFLSAFCFFVLVKAVQVEPSGWRSRLTRACALPLGPRPRGVGNPGRRSVGRTAPAALSAVRSQHGRADGPIPALAERTIPSFPFSFFCCRCGGNRALGMALPPDARMRAPTRPQASRSRESW